MALPNHWKLMFPSDYLSAPDLQGRDVTVEIEAIELDKLRRADNTTEMKFIARLKGKKKKWVLNVENSQTLAKLHGKDPHKWIGRRVTLWPTTCLAFGETVECIRVRPKKPPAE